MRALRIWTNIAEWRWTPAVGLALGALSYISLALLVIPDQIGEDEHKASRSIGTFQSLRNRTTAFAASIAPSLTDNDEASHTDAVAPTPPAPAPVAHVSEANFPRRGFTPPLERVEPPPPPPPPPPPTPEIVVQPPPPAPAEAPPAPPPAPAPVQPAPPAAPAVAAPVPPPTGPEQPAQPQPPPPGAAPEPGQAAPPAPAPQ